MVTSMKTELLKIQQSRSWQTAWTSFKSMSHV